MSSVENTIGMGLSKIQDGLDKGKNKVELMKEISKLNKSIDDINTKKAEAILELGLYTYKKVREGMINDKDILDKCDCIVGFDHIIYENKRKINELKLENEGFICSCGTSLSYDDKFCGGCGQKVTPPINNDELILCNRCDTKIKVGSHFCSCCGVKLY